jgi:hypothetical protein
MIGLGDATLRLSEATSRRRMVADDAARDERLGDVVGQTQRAQEHAQALLALTRVDVVDPVTVRPDGWPT